MKIEKALEELRKEKKRKFIQTVDLIVNLKNFDARKESVNSFVQLPNPSQKRICAFLNKKSKLVDTITKPDFDRYKTDADIKNLDKKYDFFIAVAPLMPSVATKFGRVLGPKGKMPSPQAGIISDDSEEVIQKAIEKMSKVVRVRTKEKSIKIPIGKEDLSDVKIKENVDAVVSSLEKILPRGNDNLKNVMIKFTMTKSIKLD